MGVIKIRGKWAIDYYDETGRRRRKAAGPDSFADDFQAARRAYRDTKARLDRGEPPLFAVSTKTVKEIAEKYWDVCKGTWAPSEAARVRIMLDAHLLPFFGHRRIGQVRRLYVEEYVAQRQREPAMHRGKAPKVRERVTVKLTAPATINKEVSRLRHLFNKAIAWGMIARNPCQGVKRLKEPPEKVAFLDGDERGRLLAACTFSPVLEAIAQTAMLTGARLGEILALTWGNVDLSRRILTFRKTKSGRVRHVPIHQDLARILLELGRPGDPAAPLFPAEWNSKRVSTAFRRASRAAGLNGFRFHDLRHDFGSWLTMRGVPIRAVQTLLGHRDLRMTERYSHLAERTLAAAVETLPALPGNGNGETAGVKVLVGELLE